MSTLDWIVLSLTLLFVVLYGIYRSREKHTMDSFLLAGQSMPWYHVTLSLMQKMQPESGRRFAPDYFQQPTAPSSGAGEGHPSLVILCIRSEGKRALVPLRLP